MNSDFKDLLHCLHTARVRYLLIGGYAVMHYSEPRYTKDLDIWVEPSVRNSKALYRALEKFGAPLTNIDPTTFKEPGVLYICGLPPARFDILTRVKGVDFETAWKRREKGTFGGKPTYFISLEDLIEAKEAAGRLQDKLDLSKLRPLLKRKSKAASKHPSTRTITKKR